MTYNIVLIITVFSVVMAIGLSVQYWDKCRKERIRRNGNESGDIGVIHGGDGSGGAYDGGGGGDCGGGGGDCGC